MTVIVNALGLDVLAATLARAEAQAPLAAHAAVEASAREVQRSWRQRWGGIRPASLAASITYDISRGPGTAKAEIGPDKSLPAGALGNLIEFGSTHNGPIPGGLPATEAQEPKFERSLGELGAKLLD